MARTKKAPQPAPPAATGSAALRWTRKQRSVLHGTRVPHRNDPPGLDVAALGWARLCAHSAASSAVALECNDAPLRERIVALRDAYRGPAPASSTRAIEALRTAVSEQESSCLGTNVWKSDLPEALAYFWASIGTEWALTMPSEPCACIRYAHRLSFEPVTVPQASSWMTPWMMRPGRHSLGMGTRYWGAVRRFVWSLADAPKADALTVGDRLWSEVAGTNRCERDEMRCALAFVFARERPWASELATAWLEGDAPCAPGSEWLLSSIDDEALATRWARRLAGTHSAHEGLLFDVVETFGAKADEVLGAMQKAAGTWMKSWWIARVERARALART